MIAPSLPSFCTSSSYEPCPLRLPRSDRHPDLEPARPAQCVQRRSGAAFDGRAAAFRSRPRGAGRDHLRQGPGFFQRRRRAPTPIAPARGVRSAWRPAGWGANSADLLTRSVNWKPVIAAPHGYAMGLALGIVLECDLIVAEAGTKFQVTETSRGLGGAKYWALLNFRGGAAFANEVALTGRFSPPRRRSRRGSSTASPPRASISKSPATSPPRSRRTRRSRCAPRCAPAAGTWSSSSARSRCRPHP